MAVKIVVDSTADIGAERAAQYNIGVVPLTVSFGDKEYLDGIEMNNTQFYERLVTSTVLPKTSTPSIAQFEDAYRVAVKGGATGILSIHLSGALSGTLNTATLAAETVRQETKVPITVIDSRTVSVGFGLPAIEAAKRAQNGDALESLATFVQGMLDHSKLYFVLDTLEYLEKGGRIGRAKAVFGTLLKVKPILCIKDGIVAPLENARSRAKALARVGELVKESGQIASVGLVATDAGADEEMTAAVRQAYQGEIVHFTLGAVVGTYAGPHAAGLFVTTTAS